SRMGGIVVAGLGAVGGRVARQAHSAFPEAEVVLVGGGGGRGAQVVAALGTRTKSAAWEDALAAAPDVVVLCGADPHLPRAESALRGGAHVVSTSGEVTDVQALLSLDAIARERDRTVVIGAAFSPGLSCVLARHAASDGPEPDEIRIAAVGAAGPACAGATRSSLGRTGREWDAGAGGWVDIAPGSGRELCWFPEPVGARDCYRGDLAEPELLHRAFPRAARISARRAAGRLELMTARVPGPMGAMARLPAAGPPFGRRKRDREGEIGALRVDVTGPGSLRVLGAIDRRAVAAGAVAAVAARWAVDGRLPPGAGGLAALATDTAEFLGRLSDRG